MSKTLTKRKAKAKIADYLSRADDLKHGRQLTARREKWI
jgi:hypothetical protein